MKTDPQELARLLQSVNISSGLDSSVDPIFVNERRAAQPNAPHVYGARPDPAPVARDDTQPNNRALLLWAVVLVVVAVAIVGLLLAVK